MKQTNKKQTVLITGGAGFIGANLVECLLEKTNWEINVLDNLSTGSLDNLRRTKNYSEKRVFFTKGDIRNKKNVEKVIKGCDFVVNLAAQTGVIPSQKNPLKDAEINILGLISLLEESRKEKIKRFIQASSAAPLGEQKMPLNEKKIPQPLSPYGVSKLAGEGYCSVFSSSFGLDTVVLRFSNVYGSYSNLKKSVVQNFIKQILKNQPVTIYSDGKQTRDFIYVEDICEAIFLSLTKKLPNKFELFHLGTGKETSVNGIFDLIKKELEKRSYRVKKPLYEPGRKGDVRRSYADISRAKKILNFRPRVGLKKGIAKTVEYLIS